jgi:adenylate kinase
VHLVLIGPPGGGKGTQAEHLHLHLGLVHVASGDLFRDHLNRRTALGLRAQSYMDLGGLVPDDVTIGMVRVRFQEPDVRRGTILDGFPRTVVQAGALDAILAEMGTSIKGVLCIDVPDEALVTRLSGRLVCRECQAPFHETANPFVRCPENRCRGEHLYRRDDDNVDTVRQRLATFHARTEPLISFYDRRALLERVPGEGSVEEVSAAMLRAVERLHAANPG